MSQTLSDLKRMKWDGQKRERDREDEGEEERILPPGTQIIWRRKNNGRAIK